ncbi:type II toxin-antitoxin system antitoxin SocA domain-containing protein [Streptococcus orisratti]|uniref:Panacea domain-containing protein n=1 Tax=Streptococcus orisratti TaxID=114652 RepID=UPI002943830B|nr:type II toxin-antitoxin system antitoxin SocA domain-containing protein [Streptococcus orisratti]
MTMEAFANHVISVANEANLSITNLQLQKILYFTLRNSRNVITQEVIDGIYDEPFLVWRYGPVVESQYERFYSYGSSPILGDFQQTQEYRPLNDMIIRFLSLDVFRMVDASHTHRFWREHESEIVFGRSDVAYPLEEVLRN